MSSAVAAGTRAFGMDRGLPFPFDDLPSRRPRARRPATRPTRCRPPCGLLEEGRERGARHVVVDPGAPRPPSSRHTHLQPLPNIDLSAGQRAAALAIRETWSTGVRRARTNGLRRRAPGRAPVLAGPRRAGHRRSRSTDLREACALRRRTGGDVPDCTGARAARRGADTVQLDQPRARARPPARPGTVSARLPGRATGRAGASTAEGGPAARLPHARRPRRPRARRRPLGRRSGRCPARAVGATRCSTAGRGRCRALLVLGRTRWCAPRTRDHVEERLRGARLPGRQRPLPVRDRAARRRRAARHAVGRGDGTMTNLEGRVILRAAVDAPPDGVRTDLEVLTRAWRSARPPGASFRRTRRRRSKNSASPARAAGRLLRGHLLTDRRKGGRLLAVPGRRSRRDPQLFLERFATADGRARFQRRQTTAGPRNSPTTNTPSIHDRAHSAQYQSGTQTRRSRGALRGRSRDAFVEIHPVLARPARDRGTGTGCACRARVGERQSPDARFDPASGPIPSSCPFIGAARPRNMLTNAAWTPESKMPEFKISAAAIEAASRAGGARRNARMSVPKQRAGTSISARRRETVSG